MTDTADSPLMGTTPILGLPEDTFSDEDRETADEWSRSYPSLDISDSPLVGGTRSDRREATVEATREAVDNALSALPEWIKWAVVGIVGLLGAGVVSYVFGQLFTIEL